MKNLVLRGIDFGKICVSSGTLNFFGEGWPYHRLYKRLFKKGFDFAGSTFISKTTTLHPRDGNMPLENNLQPREIFPDCIRVYFRMGIVLNSVGLSGPGAKALFEINKWQNRTEPFMISFMSLGETTEDKVEEAELFVDLLMSRRHEFKAPFGVQVNGSCPNTECSTDGMFNNSLAILKPFQRLEVPIDYKIGIVDAINAGVRSIKEIEYSSLCDCLTCSNTVPWGKLPGLIDWQELFGSTESPLEHLGGGGLSGWPLQVIVLGWLKKVRKDRVSMPIKVGGGIMNTRDIMDFARAGASAFEIGSVSILRPWRVQKIIQKANNI